MNTFITVTTYLLAYTVLSVCVGLVIGRLFWSVGSSPEFDLLEGGIHPFAEADSSLDLAA